MTAEQRARQHYAERVRQAVEDACRERPLNPGQRIEELLGHRIPNHPDEIKPLSALPEVDGLPFVGWTPEFEAVTMQQAAAGGACMQVSTDPKQEPDYIVGWKPVKTLRLAVTIHAEEPQPKVVADGFLDFLSRRRIDRH